MDLDPKDLRIDTYRKANQLGGWNTTVDTCVRITHIPSGIEISECADRSVHRNRAEAMRKMWMAFNLVPELFKPLVQKPREEFLDMALECGAVLTGKPDGSEPITVVFTIEAWRKFDRTAGDRRYRELLLDIDELPQYKQTWDSTTSLLKQPLGDYYLIEDVQALIKKK